MRIHAQFADSRPAFLAVALLASAADLEFAITRVFVCGREEARTDKVRASSVLPTVVEKRRNLRFSNSGTKKACCRYSRPRPELLDRTAKVGCHRQDQDGQYWGLGRRS
jgi:hypothetical protein